uniref:Variant surface glycoprotein 1048 n=1 Tax=Trypanosoma brucei TaxID=5691 RepID=M4TAN3_9TRYP|nr:variant surface glycoprotein 1048 [Trypanosoma brucei]
MKAAQDCTTAAVALWLMIALTHPQLSEATKNAACSSPCDCKVRLQKILNYYAKRIQAAEQRADDNIKNLIKLQIAALHGDSQQAKQAVPVIGAAGQIITDCKAKLKVAQGKLNTATVIAAKVEKAYAIMQHFLKATSQLKLTADGSGHFKENAAQTKTLGKVDKTNCEGPTEGERRADITSTTAGEEPNITEFKIKARTKIKCSNNQGGASCHTTTIGNSGWIEVTVDHTMEAVTDTTTTTNTATHTKAMTFGNEIDLLDGNITALNTELKELKQADPTTACAAQITDYNSLTGKGLFKRLAIKALLQKIDNEKEETSPAGALDTALTAEYGTDGANFNKVVYETPGNKQTEISDDGKKKTEPLKSVETFTDLADALARATLKRLAIETDPQASGEPTLKGVQGCSDKKRVMTAKGIANGIRKKRLAPLRRKEREERKIAKLEPQTPQQAILLSLGRPLFCLHFLLNNQILRIVGKRFLFHFVKFTKFCYSDKNK